jgi:ABC-type polysaccharide/polyol phosphate transport system ATPase subunit
VSIVPEVEAEGVEPARGADPASPGATDAAATGASGDAASPPPMAGGRGPMAISASDIGVRYSLRFTKKTTLRQSMGQILSRERMESFWALRNVSFDVERGESLAVIGPNGAGKSTLLQVLAGIILPSEGAVEVNGHISSLLTLGAGFDQDLSGRDNILLAGAFMGLDDPVVRELLPSIVDYADLGQFIDAPIKTYSSGMRARLGFAIATSVDPDILLLDEVLATGDAEFRAKSKARVIELVRAAKGIVLVTHDMAWVSEYCNRAMLLEKGQLIIEGAPAEVVKVHEERSAQRKAERAARLGGTGL